MDAINARLNEIIVERDSAQQIIADKCDKIEAVLMHISDVPGTAETRTELQNRFEMLLEKLRNDYVEVARAAVTNINNLGLVDEMIKKLRDINADLKNEQNALEKIARTIVTINDVIEKCDALLKSALALKAVV